MRARRRFGEMTQGDGRVVPFRKVAYQRRTVEHRMSPVHVAPAFRRVELRSDDGEYRGPVRPGVVDCHRSVLQAHRRMHHAGHGFARDLGVTMRDGDRDLFMHAGNELEGRCRRHAVVDDRLVQAFEGVARNRGDVLDTQAAHHVNHEVAAATRLDYAAGVRGTLFAVARCDLYGVTLCRCCRVFRRSGFSRYNRLRYGAGAGERRGFQESAPIERGARVARLSHAPGHQNSMFCL